MITKLLYLQHQGDTFTKKEASEVFFAVTKLFQNAEMNLRRMVYLCLKDICPDAEEVMIVTNSLMKDMNAPQELYRANSIRVLRSIIDGAVLQQLERYFKQGIVDKAPIVASSALVAGLHLFSVNAEVVKRWASEIQEAVQSKHAMVQYHAIALQTAIKSSDRLAISKILHSLTATSIRSPMAQCLVIKYIAKVLKDTTAPPEGEKRPFYDYLVASLRHKSDMVMFQAARTISELRDVAPRELAPAITVLHLFLSSAKPVLRFAAVRILNTVSAVHPSSVTNCNIELEQLMMDSNRSVAVYAITTLLKTGSESSVDRLLKQIRTFTADIADDFKVVVVRAIKALCLKYPRKNRVLLNFLAHMLREEGGPEFKRAIVEALVALIQSIEEAREPGLLHLAEFIEDCEFTPLAVQVLHLLGEMAPDTADPARFVRFIYNRVILENATVRAAATSALAAICARCPKLRDRIIIILRRSLADSDDEVRDRCTAYLAHLESRAGTPEMVVPKLGVPLGNLEKALRSYLASPMDAEFDIETVDKAVEEPAVPLKKGKKTMDSAPAPAAAADEEDLGKEVEANPAFASFGPRFKSCKAVAVTEEDTEYDVSCVKHVFGEHIVLQFNCMNTISDQVLENVTVDLDLAELEGMEALDDVTAPLKRMPHNSTGSTFLVLMREEGSMSRGTAGALLKFTVKEVDATTGEVEEDGYEDEYPLEDIEISYSDYMKPKPVGNFKAAWEELDTETEVSGDYSLGEPQGGVRGIVEAMIEHMGMYVAEGTDIVTDNARSHSIMLSGELCGGHTAVVRISFGLDASGSMAMKVVSRADSPEVSQLLHEIVQDA